MVSMQASRLYMNYKYRHVPTPCLPMTGIMRAHAHYRTYYVRTYDFDMGTTGFGFNLCLYRD